MLQHSIENALRALYCCYSYKFIKSVMLNWALASDKRKIVCMFFKSCPKRRIMCTVHGNILVVVHKYLLKARRFIVTYNLQ